MNDSINGQRRTVAHRSWSSSNLFLNTLDQEEKTKRERLPHNVEMTLNKKVVELRRSRDGRVPRELLEACVLNVNHTPVRLAAFPLTQTLANRMEPSLIYGDRVVCLGLDNLDLLRSC